MKTPKNEDTNSVVTVGMLGKVIAAEDSIGKNNSLSDLCSRVKQLTCSYEDVAEQIEDNAYNECESGNLNYAIEQLVSVAFFFEKLENKNEEVSRDLAQIYLLIGQIYQYCGFFEKSILWLKRSVVVDDQFAAPYHSLAISYKNNGDIKMAQKSLIQEITVEPGNYYSYLLLADLYEQSQEYEEAERCLINLLKRDPQNSQALHRLIVYYKNSDPKLDTDLLRKRIINKSSNLNRIEVLIRTYHLCTESHFNEALQFIFSWSEKFPHVTITHLVAAHIYGELGQYARKRRELSLFKQRNHGREQIILNKLGEFQVIFGKQAAGRLKNKLLVSYPGAN
ncbi:tetratricopeptide repeat protein [Chitinispirillales bacterium ANBcel5]|uniref:tetratricopeptide repeat protein n=1 Tax=Cellulosispirillum alkaliphilum TaxID=3039283 RepID=UPI002A4EECEA|nr:tetratricopeptide repeat protein [Chitinispirillales bacterium ANBcel5]